MYVGTDDSERMKQQTLIARGAKEFFVKTRARIPMAKAFSFADILDEVQREEERKRLEKQATEFLRRCGLREDGRSRTEHSESVRAICHCNGPRH